MSRKQESATFSITSEELASLEAIAYSLGFHWANKGNVSGLLRAIANGEIAVGDYQKSESPNKSKIKNLLGEIERLL